MKAYITLWALTKGIVEVEGEEKDGGYLFTPEMPHTRFRPGEWHRTKSEAVKDVLLKISRKRSAIQAQIKKLDKLEAKLKAEKG